MHMEGHSVCDWTLNIPKNSNRSKKMFRDDINRIRICWWIPKKHPKSFEFIWTWIVLSPPRPCKQLVVTSITVPFLVFPWVHLPLEECINDKLLHEIVSNFQCLSSWNTVHSKSRIHAKLTQFCVVVTASQFVLHMVAKDSVLIALSTIGCPITSSGRPDLSWSVSSSSHISATAQ